MKRKVAKSLGLSFSVFLLIVITAFGALAVNIGRHSFDFGFSNKPLQVAMNGAAGLSSPSFVSRVGGVAFEAVAAPEVSLKDGGVSLSYDAKQRDGSRLAVTIGSKTYNPNIPNWQLIPITNFADSQYTACVSLFGSESTREAYHIVYHPAFNDTLLGLRLMQADILFQDLGEFWKLPEVDGRVIRGQGEPQPSEQDWISAASEISKAFGKEKFQSWVLTDQGLNVSILTKSDDLSLSNRPYYYFWKREGSKVVPVTSLTDRMKSKLSTIEQYNPAVFNAATRTMQFAALFRYVKRTNPDSWRSFLNKVATLDPQPHVRTPTRWKRPSRSSSNGKTLYNAMLRSKDLDLQAISSW
ncbi:hypothetical protein [Stenomitos frigidus]|uniref:Uncharacterized protein n=1 Tax=Stenomitos frigidus ULC18 TaxID=2107698 RepID=A0A2T1E3H0_9CYAN|nr:hypothetical protein [Stenomitos frigidus]PSB27287.1 hypothetical protein C7B82_16705 [Stenomitos frigidus ULC18]